MSIDLEQTFPHAIIRLSNDMSYKEQSFDLDGSKITIVTLFKNDVLGGITCAGVVTDGHFQTGHFQQRGYVGNPLKGAVIEPIMPIKRGGIYNLTLDGTVTSFSFQHGKWQSDE